MPSVPNGMLGDIGTVHGYLLRAARHWWREITKDQRGAWDDYANVYLDDFPLRRDGSVYETPGAQVYAKVAFLRQALQQEIPCDPPPQGPPPPIRAFTVQVDNDSCALGLRVEHDICDPSAIKILARLSMPANDNTGRLPAMRFLCGVGPDSFADLPANTDHLICMRSRVPIDCDTRASVELTLVSHFGVPSLAVTDILLRRE